MKKALKKLKPLLLQAIIICILSAAVPLAAILFGLSAALTIGYWVLLPLTGFLTAMRTTRRGLNCYLAWIAPPFCMCVVPWLLVGYSPYAGSTLLCVLTSIIGAATGDVINRRKDEGNNER